MGILKRPKMPEPTAEDKAVTARQKVALNKEIEEQKLQNIFKLETDLFPLPASHYY